MLLTAKITIVLRIKITNINLKHFLVTEYSKLLNSIDQISLYFLAFGLKVKHVFINEDHKFICISYICNNLKFKDAKK